MGLARGQWETLQISSIVGDMKAPWISISGSTDIRNSYLQLEYRRVRVCQTQLAREASRPQEVAGFPRPDPETQTLKAVETPDHG